MSNLILEIKDVSHSYDENETTFDNMSAVPFSFSLMTAAAVSSQLVSIPKKVIFSFIINP